MATLLFEELAQGEITLAPAEVRRMLERFGEKTLQMGHLREDGSMSVPFDCIAEAIQSLGGRKMSESMEAQRGQQMASMLESVDALVERVVEARKRKLERMVEEFQSEPSDANAPNRWKEIEKTIFGVKFPT